MKKYIFSALMLAAIPMITTGCLPTVMASTAVVGTTIAEDRTAGDKLDDNIMSVKIKESFIHEDLDEIMAKVTVSVYEGRVMLTGSVTKEEYAHKAVDLAWKILGVKEVINEIQVAKREMKDLAKDTFIENTVRSKLLLEKNLKSVNYIVDSHAGVVYLLGLAQDDTELRKAIDISRGVKGVRQVVSHVLMKNDPRRLKKKGQ